MSSCIGEPVMVVEAEVMDEMSNKKVYKCPKCHRCFPKTGHLKSHYRKSHDQSMLFTIPDVYTCYICNKIFKQNYRMQNHIKCVHQKKKVKKSSNESAKSCLNESVTSSKTSSESSSRRITRSCNEKSTLNILPQAYNKDSTVTQHDSFNYCIGCHVEISEEMNAMGNSNEEIHLCDICENNFKDPLSLEVHKKTHKRIMCDLCQDENDQSKCNCEKTVQYWCEVCKIFFNLKKELQLHYTGHLETKALYCDACWEKSLDTSLNCSNKISAEDPVD